MKKNILCNMLFLLLLGCNPPDMDLLLDSRYDPVVKMELSSEKKYLLENKSMEIIPVIKYRSGKEKIPYSGDVIWQSSMPDIVSVSENGIVKAESPGSSEITAMYKEYSVSTKIFSIKESTGVFVNSDDVMRLEIQCESSTMEVNQGQYVSVIAVMKNGDTVTVDPAQCVYKSSNMDILSVDTKGLVSAVARGRADIRVYVESKTKGRIFSVVRDDYEGGVVINEIFYDSEMGEDGFIEIYNGTDGNQNLKGYGICSIEENEYFTLSEDLFLDVGAVYVIAGSRDGFYTRFGFFPDMVFSRLMISSKGDTVVLSDSSNSVIDKVYIMGGATCDRADFLWGRENRPYSYPDESIERFSIIDTDSSYDWESGLPTPGRP